MKLLLEPGGLRPPGKCVDHPYGEVHHFVSYLCHLSGRLSKSQRTKFLLYRVACYYLIFFV